MKLDREQVAQAVRAVVLEVAREQAPERAAVSDQQALVADLAVASLDLARIVVLLEAELQADPFAERMSITEVRTVGDLIQAYVGCLFEPDTARDIPVDEGRARAEARRAALPRSRPRRASAPEA